MWRDLLTPAAIVIAGACIGIGLYAGSGTAPQPVTAAAPTPSDNTSLVNPVTADDYIKGDPQADIVIVEYSDFDCPFCGRFHASMDELLVSNPDVAWVYRHFPLDQLHPQARGVSIAAECVGDIAGNDAFWQFTDGYFAARSAGDASSHEALLARLATESGVDQTAFVDCLASGEMDALVQEDYENAGATGGRGTPWSILIGPTGKTYPINGAMPAATIQQLIQVARDEA